MAIDDDMITDPKKSGTKSLLLLLSYELYQWEGVDFSNYAIFEFE